MLGMKTNLLLIIKNIIMICLIVSVHSVSAQDRDDKLSFNGYYTFDYTYVDDDLNISSPSGRRNLSENDYTFNNSIFGGQLKYNFTDAFSVFVQGSLTTDNRGSLTTDIDWAYLSYDFGNDLKARIGKFQMPLLSGTELRKISYARLWARPLIPGNGASGYAYYEGIDVIKNIATDNANWDFQFAVGKGEHGLNEVDNKNIKLMSVRYQRDNYWIRAALMGTEYTLTTPRGDLLIESGESILASLESEININNFQINLGISTSDAQVVPDDSMVYLSLGYRIQNFTPFIYGVKLNQSFPFFEPPPPSGPPPMGPPMGPPPSPPFGDRNTYSLAMGVRWDIKANLAMKFQLENIREQDETRVPQNGIVSTQGNALTIILEGVF